MSGSLSLTRCVCVCGRRKDQWMDGFFFSYKIICQTQDTIQLFGAPIPLSLCVFIACPQNCPNVSPLQQQEHETGVRALNHQ